MSEVPLLRFGSLEGGVLNALWTFEETTIRDLHNLLGEDELSLSVLRATLEKLQLKRLVRIRQVHRTTFYRPAIDRQTFVKLLGAQLANFLGNEGMALLQDNFQAV